MSSQWNQRKRAVHSRHGVVAAQHRLAAEAGAQVLAEGGNAMDAAVVTALVLSVVEPWLSGVGGGGFLLHADARGQVDALDFNVRAPHALDPQTYPLAQHDQGNWFDWPSVLEERNSLGYHSICVPGAVAGLSAALERFGTLSWADALAPAIEHAERGLEVDWYAALCLSIESAALARFPATAELLLEQGRAPRVAEGAKPHYRPMPAKARLLRRLAQAGARDFYEGESADRLVADLRAGGSAIRGGDLADYQARWLAPLRGRYREHEVYAIPGLSGGPSALQAFVALERHTFTGGSPDASAALAYARALQEANRTRLTRMGHASLGQDPGCTSHVSVVDAQGRFVSLTNTLLSRFGSKVVLPESGILMNNGMLWFDPRAGQPNSIAPGAQPLANMCPLLLGRHGRIEQAIGAAGGRAIVPALVQLVSYQADYGMTLEEAFHAPRLDASSSTLKVNSQAGGDIAASLAREFATQIVEDTLYPVNFAIPSAVVRLPDSGENIGMAHPTSPWSAAAEGAPTDAR
ncbi:MAG TPA: gamma-glutamyltransferase [Pseudomonas sp.]|uniref:gamma-glutamyltransferase family protein n=1 Tax=Pseudomonas sp. TaxID=306 RepID=UPI002B47E0B2|nr:gamma-glutamyltransferase [Pseudomonas sp.]HKS13616.1 gamma-glutamyltransferase [Pseudomonas sp.]